MHPIIAIEGIDGSGKTEVCKRVAEEMDYFYLKTPDFKLEKTRQIFDSPNINPIARFHFYISALWISWSQAQKLRINKPVLFDRFSLSTQAYHLFLCDKNYPVSELINICSPKADLNIYLKVKVETAQDRIKKRINKNRDLIFETNIKLQLNVCEFLEKNCDVSINNEISGVESAILSCKMILKNYVNNYPKNI